MGLLRSILYEVVTLARPLAQADAKTSLADVADEGGLSQKFRSFDT
jgi:hypothetical protein